MKKSKHDRKMFNQGKQAGYHEGYYEGYKKGLYDGNPFNAMIDALSNLANSLSEAIKENPELLEEWMKSQALEIEDAEDEEL